jgi:uncharacterized membrane protein YhaH (DUF805 family)
MSSERKLESRETGLTLVKDRLGYVIASSGGRTMEKLNAWVSSEGRLSRKGYALLFLSPLAALVVFTWLAWIAAPDVFGGMQAALLVMPWMLFLKTADAQNIKRWRDLGNSAAIYKIARPLVVVLPVLAMVVEFVLPGFMVISGDMGALSHVMAREFGGISFGPLPLAMLGLTFVGVIGNITYLAAMPGQSGPNSFGPDPLSGVKLPGFAAANTDEIDDPVKRALTEYQARSARPAAMVTQVRPTPGGGFGKKRV